MSDDLIRRQEAIDGILQLMPTKLRDDATLEEQINYVAWRSALGCAVSSVGTQPPAHRKKGKWFPVPNTRLVTCECGFITDRLCKYNFCPDCGAEMVKGETDD